MKCHIFHKATSLELNSLRTTFGASFSSKPLPNTSSHLDGAVGSYKETGEEEEEEEEGGNVEEEDEAVESFCGRPWTRATLSKAAQKKNCATTLTWP